jgi:hypothetical protein
MHFLYCSKVRRDPFCLFESFSFVKFRRLRAFLWEIPSIPFCCKMALAPELARIMNLHPHPDLSPEEVVRIQLTALKYNDIPQRNAGIAKAYEFASPGREKAN